MSQEIKNLQTSADASGEIGAWLFSLPQKVIRFDAILLDISKTNEFIKDNEKKLRSYVHAVRTSLLYPMYPTTHICIYVVYTKEKYSGCKRSPGTHLHPVRSS